MKDKVIKLMIKRGHNQSQVLEMVEKSLELACKLYPDAKAGQLADFILWDASH